MAKTNSSQQQTHQPNAAFHYLFQAIEPISLIVSQNPNLVQEPAPLRLTTEKYIMERGPRYKAYAELREAKLRMKYLRPEEPREPELKPSPLKKQVKYYQTNPTSAHKGSSVLAQPVPEFSAALRKDNRKTPTRLPSMKQKTPPAKTRSKANGVLRKENRKPLTRLPSMQAEKTPLEKTMLKANGVLSNLRGSKSASAGEKRYNNGGRTMPTKSSANIEELRGLSSTAVNDISGQNRGRKSGSGRASHETVLRYRQF